MTEFEDALFREIGGIRYNKDVDGNNVDIDILAPDFRIFLGSLVTLQWPDDRNRQDAFARVLGAEFKRGELDVGNSDPNDRGWLTLGRPSVDQELYIWLLPADVANAFLRHGVVPSDLVRAWLGDAWKGASPAKGDSATVPMSQNEYRSLQCLVIGMAVSKYNYSPNAPRNPAIPRIEKDLETAGVPLDKKTIRKWLKLCNERRNTLCS